jgi:predicted PurR-regulated permease PerM
MSLVKMDIFYTAFLISMNNIKKIKSFSLVAGMFLVAALATSTVINTRTAFAQNTSTAINETATQLNETASKLMQTAAQLNQTAAQSANRISTNQTSASKPDLSKQTRPYEVGHSGYSKNFGRRKKIHS